MVAAATLMGAALVLACTSSAGRTNAPAASCGKPKMGATGAWIASHPAKSACGSSIAGSCEHMCTADSRCKAWQWMQPSPNASESATCYLKSELGLAPNAGSTSGELHRPPPPPPPPPSPPPPPFQTTVSVNTEASRPIVLYGYGNELCYQSLNDSVLNKAIASSGGMVGRYPGGTPSDYWHWDTGWATDLSSYAGPRRATPTTWARYARESATQFTIFDTNQLTANLSYAIAGLKAHEAAGSEIKYVELGNEMYDSSRADVMAAYPNGSAYAEKMAGWTRAIKTAFPRAQVALIGCRWNAYRKQREDDWNKQVLQNPVSAQADAATLHIYCPFDETNNSSDFNNLAKHLAQAYFRAEQNADHVHQTIPSRLRLWVTEMGVYPAGPLLWTWLEALFYAMLDLLLPQISQVDIVTPYCLVCGDPTAPSFIAASENANVPPSQAGSVPWKLSLKGYAQSLIFQAAKGAADHRRANSGSGRQMEQSSVGMMAPLHFAQNPELDSSVSGSRALLGWRFGAAAMVVINAGPATAILELKNSRCHSWRGSYPKREADLTVAGLLPSDLGVLSGNCTGVGTFEESRTDGTNHEHIDSSTSIELPGYSIVSISL